MENFLRKRWVIAIIIIIIINNNNNNNCYVMPPPPKALRIVEVSKICEGIIDKWQVKCVNCHSLGKIGNCVGIRSLARGNYVGFER